MLNINYYLKSRVLVNRKCTDELHHVSTIFYFKIIKMLFVYNLLLFVFTFEDVF